MYAGTMRFDVYGKYEIEVRREGGSWKADRLGGGKRRPLHDLVLPPDLPEDQVATHLDDLLHEQAGPGETVRRIA